MGFRKADKVFKLKQKRNYDSRYGVRQQLEILDDSEVWITTDKEPVRGRVSSSADTPRSYNVEHLLVRRNRHQLNTVPEQGQETNDHDAPSDSEPEREPPQRIVTRSHRYSSPRQSRSLNLRGEMWKDTLMLHSCGCIYFLCMYVLLSDVIGFVSPEFFELLTITIGHLTSATYYNLIRPTSYYSDSVTRNMCKQSANVVWVQRCRRVQEPLVLKPQYPILDPQLY